MKQKFRENELNQESCFEFEDETKNSAKTSYSIILLFSKLKMKQKFHENKLVKNFVVFELKI